MVKLAHTSTRLITILTFCLILFISNKIEAKEIQTRQTPYPTELFESYRNLSLKVRDHSRFKIPLPSQGDLEFNYQFQLGKPVFDRPIIRDYATDETQRHQFRVFYDKILLEDGSFIELSGEQVPLTCIFIRGQDHRLAKDSPLLPDLLLQVYLVANDYSCTGPINPGWPENGGRKESWDTYLRFDVRDPTIMLPVETVLRYRWNEYSAILQDTGPSSKEMTP